MLRLRLTLFRKGQDNRSQKHDINHKKTEVNKMAKVFCEFGNNQTGVVMEEEDSPSG